MAESIWEDPSSPHQPLRPAPRLSPLPPDLDPGAGQRASRSSNLWSALETSRQPSSEPLRARASEPRGARPAPEPQRPRVAPQPSHVELPEHPTKSRSRVPASVVGLAVMMVALTTVIAYLVGSRQQQVFGARAEVLVQSNRFASDTVASRDIETQTVVLTSRAVLGSVARVADTSISRLERSVSVEVVGGSGVVRLTVEHENRAAAKALAQAILSSYIERTDSASDTDETTSHAKGRAGPRVTILTRPYVLPDPLEPNPRRAAAGGALAGLVMAAGMVFVVAQLRSR